MGFSNSGPIPWEPIPWETHESLFFGCAYMYLWRAIASDSVNGENYRSTLIPVLA
jgi:hypothetical protein